jgi:hypothetical protein
MNITTKIHFMIEGKVYILTTVLDYKPKVEDIFSTSLMEVSDCLEEVADFKIIAITNNLPIVKNLELKEECFDKFYEEEINLIVKEWREEYNLIFGDLKEIKNDKKAYNLFFDELETRLKKLRLEFDNILNKYNAKGKRFTK